MIAQRGHRSPDERGADIDKAIDDLEPLGETPALPPGDGLDIVRHNVFDCIAICEDDLAAGLLLFKMIMLGRYRKEQSSVQRDGSGVKMPPERWLLSSKKSAKLAITAMRKSQNASMKEACGQTGAQLFTSDDAGTDKQESFEFGAAISAQQAAATLVGFNYRPEGG
jgi:hypothetical protein